MAISVANFILACHWFVTALGSPWSILRWDKWMGYPNPIQFLRAKAMFPSRSAFCQINAWFSIFSAGLLYWYNVMFLIYTWYLVENVLKNRSIPKFRMHVFTITVTTALTIYLWSKGKLGISRLTGAVSAQERSKATVQTLNRKSNTNTTQSYRRPH